MGPTYSSRQRHFCDSNFSLAYRKISTYSFAELIPLLRHVRSHQKWPAVYKMYDLYFVYKSCNDTALALNTVRSCI